MLLDKTRAKLNNPVVSEKSLNVSTPEHIVHMVSPHLTKMGIRCIISADGKSATFVLPETTAAKRDRLERNVCDICAMLTHEKTNERKETSPTRPVRRMAPKETENEKPKETAVVPVHESER